MFRHLEEDWPWLVVPALIIAALAAIAVLAMGGDAESTFTYAL